MSRVHPKENASLFPRLRTSQGGRPSHRAQCAFFCSSLFHSVFNEIQGFNMAQKLEQGSIAFVDVPTQFPDLSPSNGTLLPLLDFIRRYIGELRGATPSLLIFDELALFQWIGHSELDVSRFARALVSSCAKASANNLVFSYLCLSFQSHFEKKCLHYSRMTFS